MNRPARNTKPKPLGDRPTPLMGETPDEFQRRLAGYTRRRDAQILGGKIDQAHVNEATS